MVLVIFSLISYIIIFLSVTIDRIFLFFLYYSVHFLLNIYEHSDTISKKREKGCPDKPVSVSSRGKEVLMDNIRIPVPAVDFHPPVYYCRRARTALQPDGNLDKDFWDDAPYTDESSTSRERICRPTFRDTG